MYETGEIIACTAAQGGSLMQIAFPGRDLTRVIEDKQAKACTVWIEDGRGITAEQRKKAYAMIRDIADYTGESTEAMKEWLKYLHISKTGCRYFSLSDCSRDTARGFITTMVDLALEWGIPLTESALKRTDDINRYLYACLTFERCAICGRQGEEHHVDAVGMGRDRTKVDDSGLRKICLCRHHHRIAHQMGDQAFMDLYHVYGILYERREEEWEESAWMH